MDEVRRRLATRKVLAQELPFRSGFHSPAFLPYLDVVRHHWDRMPLQAPRIPLWSATTCDRYPAEAAEVRRLAADHLVQPVRFRQLLERLFADGVRVFVQLGVGSLVAFADDTLRTRAAQHPGGLAEAIRPRPARAGRCCTLGRGGRRAPRAAARTHPCHRVGGRAAGPHRAARSQRPLRPAARDRGVQHRGAVGPGAAAPRGRRVRRPLSHVRAELDRARGRVHLGHRAESVRPWRSSSSTSPGSGGTPAARTGGDPDESSETLSVDLDALPWLVDHCFYRQPEGWADLPDRFPVLPMTTMVELMAQAAARLVPDLVVTRIDNIRALRWLAAAPPARVTLSARRTGAHQVDTVIDGHAPGHGAPRRRSRRLRPRRLHRFAIRARRSAPTRSTPSTGCSTGHPPGPAWDRRAGRRRHRRHDRVPAGAFLDNAGQLYGWWVMATADADFLALPQSIERIEWFGPRPPDGERVSTTVRIADLDDRTVRADLELVWDGSVVTRIAGWVDRRFDSDPQLWCMLAATPTATCSPRRWRPAISPSRSAEPRLRLPPASWPAATSARRSAPSTRRSTPATSACGSSAASPPRTPCAIHCGARANGATSPSRFPWPTSTRRSSRSAAARRTGHTLAVATASWIGVAAVDVATITSRSSRGPTRRRDRRTSALTAAPTCCDRRCRCRVTRQQSIGRQFVPTADPAPQRSPSERCTALRGQSSADSESPPAR